MKNYKNAIYIITNPLYAGYVKIGYASDLQQRLSTLNTGMLRNFEAYAVYETPVRNADKEYHAIIDDLAPIVRARVINGQKVQDKEFYKLEPEQAYDILRHIAIMTGTTSQLHRIDELQTLPPAAPYIQQSPSAAVPAKQQIDSPSLSSAPSSVIRKTTKPLSFICGNVSYPFLSWSDSLIKHCEIIISNVGFTVFRDTVNGIKMGQTKNSKRVIFSTNSDDIRFSKHKFLQGELYLCTNYSAESIHKINQKLDDLFPNLILKYVYPNQDE